MTAAPAAEALVIVGLSVVEVHDRAALLERAAALRAEGRRASVAFLQQAEPSLASELTRLADEGVRRIELVAVGEGPLTPGVSWLRRVAAHWWRERADAPDVVVGDRPVTGSEAGLTSPAWDRPPPAERQVLVCRGPRCTAKGAEEGLRGLLLGLVAADVSGVQVVQTGCLEPCNHAPVVCVQPDGEWYGEVDGSAARRIVEDHLAGGVPVADLRAGGSTNG